jgi:hypothetical protein
MLLKDRGFNEPCIASYDDYDDTGTPTLNPLVKWHEIEGINPSDVKHAICAPLYAQVIDWFREVHQIDIFIDAHYKTDNSVAGYLFNVYDRKIKYDSTHKGCFESANYYEALNKAIEEAIKLI